MPTISHSNFELTTHLNNYFNTLRPSVLISKADNYYIVFTYFIIYNKAAPWDDINCRF